MKKMFTITVVALAVIVTGCAAEKNQTVGEQRSAVKKEELSSLEVSESVALDALGVSVARQSKQQIYTLPASPERLMDRDKYIHFDDNTIKLVNRDPVSTFSVDVDTASYSNVRRMLEAEGRLPPMDAVKVEEMINYFSYDYPSPDSTEVPFSVSTEVVRSPWNPDRHLLQIGLKGYEPEIEERPVANLVFLIDVSGSMMDANKLPLVKRSLRLLVNQMTPEDRIALVVYAGAAGLVLDSTSGSEKRKILGAIDRLQAGGSTNGGAGLQLAYQVAEDYKIENGINRVLIASDGDMNVGIADHESLKNMIERNRRSGIALTTLGFGTGNYNYALMEQLADVGNGNAAYIDTIKEAQKVLVNEMQSTLLTIAKDVKIQIEFNPAVVSQYRLVGYENRVLDNQDFRNDKVDAGDIGSGHTVTAFYEISLANSDTGDKIALRYANDSLIQGAKDPIELGDELAFVKLRFKQPNANVSQEISQPILTRDIKPSLEMASANMRFAASVAGFGQILRGGKYTGNWQLGDVVDLAKSAKGNDLHGYRIDFIRLVELTRSMGLEG